MHIPDGFLDAKTAIATATISAIGVGVAVYHLRRSFPRHKVPMLGLSAAFIFAAQMLNFPVLGGTSGHLIGAVLAAVLLGPHAAVLVMSSVLILQCFLFADGGVTALGANILNMGIVAPNIGYAIYQLLRRFSGTSLRGRLFATAFAAWCSTVAAAILCAGEMALSNVVGWQVAFPAMTTIHLLIGIGEAVITTLVVYALASARPELLADTMQPATYPRTRDLLVYGMLISAALAIFVAPFACSWPDGLDHVASTLGFTHNAVAHPLISSPLSDYSIPGLDSAIASTVIAGVIGLVLAFVLSYLLARKLTPTDLTK